MKQLPRTLLVLFFLSASLGTNSGFAGDPPPPPIYLPVISGVSMVTITGTVKDVDSQPIPNVTIRDNFGVSTVTDEKGEYSLQTRKEDNLLTAQNPGFTFEPEQRFIEADQILGSQDFNGIVACGDIMVNGEVTVGNGGWDFPQKDPWDYATPGTDNTVFRSGPTSGRTGIPPWANPSGPDNINVHSNAISQKYHIPSDANHVLLSVHLYSQSNDLTDNDRQYVKFLDEDNNTLQVLWDNQKNDTVAWDTYFEWDINAYVGNTIKIEIGTYNDGTGGVSRMYFDDVQLLVCKQEGTPPACNLVANSDFESGTSGWIIPGGQVFPPVISMAHANAGVRSMQTGNTALQSFSEFYQDVAIPASAVNATLKFDVYTNSEYPVFHPGSIPTGPLEGDTWNRILTPDREFDMQYAYVLTTSDVVLKKLIWWPEDDSDSWTHLEFDLSAYKGQTVRIRFGTYNNGDAYPSAMWVDTVYLDACTGVAPPVGCYEALSNRGFENNSAWVIPATAYSAGYSTLQAHAGLRSMRAGIYYASHNTYSYSDFRQVVTIPNNATSAEFRIWIWPKSTEPNAVPLAAKLEPDLLVPQNVNGRLVMSPSAGDVQYILVLDKFGNWIDSLWWKNNPTRDDRSWNSHLFDLMLFKGKTIFLQPGVYNNGVDGVTSMFLDDASVQICVPNP